MTLKLGHEAFLLQSFQGALPVSSQRQACEFPLAALFQFKVCKELLLPAEKKYWR